MLKEVIHSRLRAGAKLDFFFGGGCGAVPVPGGDGPIVFNMQNRTPEVKNGEDRIFCCGHQK
jgi:hypothetical protein